MQDESQQSRAVQLVKDGFDMSDEASGAGGSWGDQIFTLLKEENGRIKGFKRVVLWGPLRAVEKGVGRGGEEQRLTKQCLNTTGRKVQGQHARKKAQFKEAAGIQRKTRRGGTAQRGEGKIEMRKKEWGLEHPNMREEWCPCRGRVRYAMNLAKDKDPSIHWGVETARSVGDRGDHGDGSKQYSVGADHSQNERFGGQKKKSILDRTWE